MLTDLPHVETRARYIKYFEKKLLEGLIWLVISKVTYLFILVGKAFYRITKTSEFQVDNESIKVLYNVFDDTVGKDLFVAFTKEFFEPILTQSLFTGDSEKVCLQVRIFTI